jgi:hypothetical protein
MGALDALRSAQLTHALKALRVINRIVDLEHVRILLFSLSLSKIHLGNLNLTETAIEPYQSFMSYCSHRVYLHYSAGRKVASQQRY